MKRFFEILVLTPREQRVVIGIVLVAMVVVAVLHYRAASNERALPHLKTMDQAGEVKTQLSDDGGAEPPN